MMTALNSFGVILYRQKPLKFNYLNYVSHDSRNSWSHSRRNRYNHSVEVNSYL